ncbi:MAG: PBECR2 nuclease fold domain-containing protein [Rubrivivax sp.]
MAEAAYGSLPFAEQIAFFQRKLNLPTTSYADVIRQEHDWAFVVAGANRDDLVAAFREAVDKVIADGATLEDFRRDFDAIVAKAGWDYNGSRDWRSQVIYRMNLRSSYAAGRYAQLMAGIEDLPFWEYVHSDAVEHPRPEHLAWNGLVLPANDPWFQVHFPPNDFGCQCSVRGLSALALQRMGKSGPDQAPPDTMEQRVIGKNSLSGPRVVTVPKGVGPGFDYTPGMSRLESAIPSELSAARAADVEAAVPSRLAALPLAPARSFAAEQLVRVPGDPASPEVQAAYAQAFLDAFGASLDRPVIFTDAVGERLVIGRDLFVAADGSLQAAKGERGPFMRMLAEALIDPDEVWTRIEVIGRGTSTSALVRRRYVARFAVDGEAEPVLVVFDVGPDGWTAITEPAAANVVAAQRVGVLLYRRSGA